MCALVYNVTPIDSDTSNFNFSKLIQNGKATDHNASTLEYESPESAWNYENIVIQVECATETHLKSITELICTMFTNLVSLLNVSEQCHRSVINGNC